MSEARELRLVGQVRRAGNSLAFFIPADEARKAGLQEGDTVDVHLRRGVPDPRGLLETLPYEPFRRSEEELWRDRL